MVILRGCERCGGDILTGNANNIRCLQCGHRPTLPIAELRRRNRRATPTETPKPFDIDAVFGTDRAAHTAPDEARQDFADDRDAAPDALCPRCDQSDAIALEKLRPHFNTCYRCRLCGHIFSPATLKKAS